MTKTEKKGGRWAVSRRIGGFPPDAASRCFCLFNPSINNVSAAPASTPYT